MRTTFTRNSAAAAARYGNAGIVSENVLRKDSWGALIEQQSTNRSTFSNDLRESDRTTQNVGTTADRVWPTTQTGGDNERYSLFSGASGSDDIFSLECKSDGIDELVVAGFSPGLSINLVDGTVLRSSSNFSDVQTQVLADGYTFVQFKLEVSVRYPHPRIFLNENGNYPTDGSVGIFIRNIQLEGAPATSPIATEESSVTRAADFFDAPGSNNEYGPGLHTWRGAVRMSRDPGEPTILCSQDHRIYASDGRLHLEGPGTLWQPPGEHKPGDLVPFYWSVQFPGAEPDFTLGRAVGDVDYWNGHLIDVVPYPRRFPKSDIRRELGLEEPGL